MESDNESDDFIYNFESDDDEIGEDLDSRRHCGSFI